MEALLAVVCTVILVIAVWTAPWPALLQHRRLQHLWLGGTVLLVMVWQMHAGLSPGLGVHFLGVTAATLIFGWDLALVMAAMAWLMLRLTGVEGWQAAGISAFCGCVLPVAISAAGSHLVQRWLPRHVFVYLLVAAFLGAMVALMAAQLSTSGWWWWSGRYPLAQIVREQWVFLPMVALVEGLLNGILVAALLIQAPHLVRGFDRRRYLGS